MIRCGVCGKAFSHRDPWNVQVVLCQTCRRMQYLGVRVQFTLDRDQHGHKCVSGADKIGG